MDKRQFLKTSGGLVVTSMLSGLSASQDVRKNWSGNYQFKAHELCLPNSVSEAQQFVRQHDKVKAIGSAHSFNSIADSSGAQISVRNLKTMTVSADKRTVLVGGAVKYGELAVYLQDNGLALHNLASLPHISVAGACATGTHGSGNKNGNLSTAVAAMELITADGKLVTLSREQAGTVVHLGGLGVVTKVTLDVQPTYDMSQVVYENLSFSHLEHHLDEIFGSAYSVSLFTDWQKHQATQVWLKARGAQPTKADFFGAKPATRKLHPLTGHSAENCTEQMGIVGPWYERLPHFRMNFTPSSGDELQSEYFVPRARGYEAILAVEKLRDHITPHLMITELRTIAADDLWMSPCYKRDSMTIHFTWKPEWPDVKKVLPLIEEALAPFDARPHWAKLFTMPPARLQSLYAKLPDYKNLLKQYDPTEKFRNGYLNTNLFVDA